MTANTTFWLIISIFTVLAIVGLVAFSWQEFGKGPWSILDEDDK